MAHGLVTAVTALEIFITCHKILGISISPNPEVEELSVNKVTVSCNQLSPDSMVYWSIALLRGQVKEVGMCEVGNCTSVHGPNVYPERLVPVSSSLVFFNVTREWAGTVVCTERFANGTKQSVNSTLDVYYNSGVNSKSVVINYEDSSLTVVFKVTKVFSALGNYGAMVDCPYMFFSQNFKANVSLVSYNESSLMYNEGYFLLTIPHSYRDNYYRKCSLNIIVHPGGKVIFFPTKRYRYMDLLTPQVGCDQAYIPEEGPCSCNCNSIFRGDSERRLRWRLGEQVLTSGNYGIERLPLPSDIVNRSHDGKDLVCEVEWIYSIRKVLKIQVAYGPDEVIIKPYTILSLKDSSNITLLSAHPAISGHVYLPPDDTFEVALICEARNIQPMKSEMVTWGGVCDSLQGFACYLTFKGEVDNGKEVTCTVTNDANNNHTANTSIILNVSDGPNNISIQYHTISTPGKCQAIFTCEAPGVKPSTRDMFEWSGMCEGQQGSRCVITVDKEEDDGKEVTCTVTNHVNHGRTASGSVTLTLSGCEDKDDPISKGVGIGIGVTLTLDLLVVGVVVVVIWRRRRFQRDQMYDTPGQDPSVSHTYEMMRAGHDTHIQESQQQIAMAPSPACEVYENITTDITAKPVKAKQQRETKKE